MTTRRSVCDLRAMRLPAIIVHGGAGRRVAEIEAACTAGCERAADAGWAVVRDGGSAVDAVLAAVVCLEDDPVFNTGIGSALTDDGRVEMDASLMEGTSRSGAGVALLTTIRNPIRAAEALWRDGRHVLLAGAGAEAFARRCGLATADPEHFITARQRQRWARRAGATGPGTVGAVAADRFGRVAAATSTGGLMGKLPGRIGDSAILGAGTYADDAAGAASATGVGEAIIVAGLAAAAVHRLRDGRGPAQVVDEVLRELVARSPHAAAGLIVVDRFGRCAAAHRAEYMSSAIRHA